MNCNDATRALSAAQEQTLAPGERTSLQSHLAICPLCRDFGEQVSFLRQSMRAYAGRADDSPGAENLVARPISNSRGKKCSAAAAAYAAVSGE